MTEDHPVSPGIRILLSLEPSNDAEQEVIDWLNKIDSDLIEPLAVMIERVARNGTASAYDRGYHEGQRYAREYGFSSWSL